jgi:hypothetical protein
MNGEEDPRGIRAADDEPSALCHVDYSTDNFTFSLSVCGRTIVVTPRLVEAMAIERASTGSSLVDVLDRVLDKGIVIDAWVRVSIVGIDLVTIEARVTVASIETYLKYAEAIGYVGHPSMKSLVVHGGHVEVTHSRARVRARTGGRS